MRAGPGAREADRQGVSYQPIPVRQQQECQLCGWHCQVAQEGGGAVASPPRPPISGKSDLAGRAVLLSRREQRLQTCKGSGRG